jgi:hypothetical protein
MRRDSILYKLFGRSPTLHLRVLWLTVNKFATLDRGANKNREAILLTLIKASLWHKKNVRPDIAKAGWSQANFV